MISVSVVWLQRGGHSTSIYW